MWEENKSLPLGTNSRANIGMLETVRQTNQYGTWQTVGYQSSYTNYYIFYCPTLHHMFATQMRIFAFIIYLEWRFAAVTADISAKFFRI